MLPKHVMMSFTNILVPVDFGEPSRHALEVAIDLATRYRSSLTLVHTWEFPSFAYGGAELSALEPFTVIEGDAQRELDTVLVHVRTKVRQAQALLKRGSPWREVLATIEDTKADLVVLGTQGRRGFAYALLGSVAEKIVRMSPVPVLTVGEKGNTTVSFKNILVPIDFGEPSRHALQIAIDLAKQFRSSVTLVHTWEIPAYVYMGSEIPATELFHPMKDVAQQLLDNALAEVRKEIPEAKGVLRGGSPWREILAVVEEFKPDLVVMGTHGRRGVSRALLGSVTEKIVRISPAPVLTVGADPSADGATGTRLAERPRVGHSWP